MEKPSDTPSPPKKENASKCYRFTLFKTAFGNPRNAKVRTELLYIRLPGAIKKGPSLLLVNPVSLTRLSRRGKGVSFLSRLSWYQWDAAPRAGERARLLASRWEQEPECILVSTAHPRKAAGCFVLLLSALKP